ncbi:CBS domain-containing protein [Streptomyces sp. TRM68416]|uniref:CBS domain-containing protein n=1 Tax=Streptomyces sp. TRM68416 TaxID=2758412 RepID=UPI001661DF82|nr:CBS domain-containing protein [Streptomyces sp. TRM68416]MBD0842068.1 CBS domain-containing protein [Streptomyces sp. TRM68416]
MDDRFAREAATSATEARRAVPAYAQKPAEEFRQTLMVRYLQAMASQSVRAAAEQPSGAEAVGHTHSAKTHTRVRTAASAELRVRDVMKRSVAGLSADTPFLDIARMLARRQTGAVPVVDDSQRVVGVVAESDLLARAASLAAPADRPGLFAKVHGRHRHAADAGDTAATLMSAPALTVHPWTAVVDAARASRSRIRQIFVTDHHDRLVGVVSRSELLQALVRDDEAIRTEIVEHVVREELGVDPAQVRVEVRNGTVTLAGSLDAELVPRLTEAVARIPDVVQVEDRLTTL